MNNTTIWHCKACGWHSALLHRGDSPGVSGCPDCAARLSFIDYDAMSLDEARQVSLILKEARNNHEQNV